jgi:hypothetical protein
VCSRVAEFTAVVAMALDVEVRRHAPKLKNSAAKLPPFCHYFTEVHRMKINWHNSLNTRNGLTRALVFCPGASTPTGPHLVPGAGRAEHKTSNDGHGHRPRVRNDTNTTFGAARTAARIIRRGQFAPAARVSALDCLPVDRCSRKRDASATAARATSCPLFCCLRSRARLAPFACVALGFRAVCATVDFKKLWYSTPPPHPHPPTMSLARFARTTTATLAQRVMARSMATGTVKWFNITKGYGFITRNDDNEGQESA